MDPLGVEPPPDSGEGEDDQADKMADDPLGILTFTEPSSTVSAKGTQPLFDLDDEQDKVFSSGSALKASSGLQSLNDTDLFGSSASEDVADGAASDFTSPSRRAAGQSLFDDLLDLDFSSSTDDRAPEPKKDFLTSVSKNETAKEKASSNYDWLFSGDDEVTDSLFTKPDTKSGEQPDLLANLGPSKTTETMSEGKLSNTQTDSIKEGKSLTAEEEEKSSEEHMEVEKQEQDSTILPSIVPEKTSDSDNLGIATDHDAVVKEPVKEQAEHSDVPREGKGEEGEKGDKEKVKVGEAEEVNMRPRGALSSVGSDKSDMTDTRMSSSSAEIDMDFSVLELPGNAHLNFETSMHKRTLSKKGSIARRKKPTRAAIHSSKLAASEDSMFVDSTEPRPPRAPQEDDIEEEDTSKGKQPSREESPAASPAKKFAGGIKIPGLLEGLMGSKRFNKSEKNEKKSAAKPALPQAAVDKPVAPAAAPAPVPAPRPKPMSLPRVLPSLPTKSLKDNNKPETQASQPSSQASSAISAPAKEVNSAQRNLPSVSARRVLPSIEGLGKPVKTEAPNTTNASSAAARSEVKKKPPTVMKKPSLRPRPDKPLGKEASPADAKISGSEAKEDKSLEKSDAKATSATTMVDKQVSETKSIECSPALSSRVLPKSVDNKESTSTSDVESTKTKQDFKEVESEVEKSSSETEQRGEKLKTLEHKGKTNKEIEKSPIVISPNNENDILKDVVDKKTPVSSSSETTSKEKSKTQEEKETKSASPYTINSSNLSSTVQKSSTNAVVLSSSTPTAKEESKSSETERRRAIPPKPKPTDLPSKPAIATRPQRKSSISSVKAPTAASSSDAPTTGSGGIMGRRGSVTGSAYNPIGFRSTVGSSDEFSQSEESFSKDDNVSQTKEGEINTATNTSDVAPIKNKPAVSPNKVQDPPKPSGLTEANKNSLNRTKRPEFSEKTKEAADETNMIIRDQGSLLRTSATPTTGDKKPASSPWGVTLRKVDSSRPKSVAMPPANNENSNPGAGWRQQMAQKRQSLTPQSEKDKPQSQDATPEWARASIQRRQRLLDSGVIKSEAK